MGLYNYPLELNKEYWHNLFIFKTSSYTLPDSVALCVCCMSQKSMPDTHCLELLLSLFKITSLTDLLAHPDSVFSSVLHWKPWKTKRLLSTPTQMFLAFGSNLSQEAQFTVRPSTPIHPHPPPFTPTNPKKSRNLTTKPLSIILKP